MTSKYQKMNPKLASLVMGAIAVMIHGGPARAGDTTDSTVTLERVEVTGSSIKRIQAEGALPIQRLSAQDIAASGATNTQDLIQRLTATQGFTAANDSVGGGGAGFAGASLHNVGESRTLVLLDGLRLASYGGQGINGGLAAIDLNTIPLAMIDHVEILTDGASALYGSDAVGGVINFVTKRDGVEGAATMGYNQPKQDGGQSYSASLSKGFGSLATDGYNLRFGASTDHQSGLMAKQRKFAETGNIIFPYNGTSLQFFNGSPRTIPANILVPNKDDPNAFFSNYYAFTHNGVCPPNHVSAFGGCYFDYVSQLEIVPEQTRNSLSGSLHLKWGEQTVFLNAMYADSKTLSQLAPPPGSISIPTTSPFYQQYAVPQGVTGDTTAQYRVFDAGGRQDVYYSKATNFVAGIEGVVGGWDYTSAITHSVNDYANSNFGGYLTTNGLATLLKSGVINPFLDPGQQSAAGVAALQAAKINGFYDGGRSVLDTLSAHGSREVFSLPAGPASLGLGANFNRERFSTTASQLAQGIGNTRFGDTGAEIPYSASRNSYGIFAELLTPVLKELEVTTAVRNDHYSDFGNTTNGKLGVRYQPTGSLLLRGSLGTGFRAPTVPQVDATKQQFGVTSGNYKCPFSPADVAAIAGPGVVCPTGTVQYQVFASGNKQLKPEKSNQWTLGFRYEPIPELSVGADLWNISIRDSIGQVDEQTIFANPQQYRNLFTTYTDPATNVTELAIFQSVVNLGKEANKGIDIDVKGRAATSIGRITSNLVATYMIKHDYELVPGAGYVSDLGQFVNGAVTFRWKVKLATALEYGDWKHTLTVNHESSYADQPYTADSGAVNTLDGLTNVAVAREVASYTTFDWQTHWNTTSALSFTAGVLNMFDRDPPLTIRSSGGGQTIGYDGRYTNPLGRTYYVNGSLKF